MRMWFKALLPQSVLQYLRQLRERCFDIYAGKSYSQEGEDMLLERFLEDRPSGFYVDVGAHHPKRFSNTYRLYCRGWRGINIDANPGSMTPFRQVRPRDINVEAAVSSTPEELTYYVFNEPALNTLDRDLALGRVNETYRIVREVTVPSPLPNCSTNTCPPEPASICSPLMWRVSTTRCFIPMIGPASLRTSS